MATLSDKFLEKVSPEPNSGCWLWDGAISGKGARAYGRFRMPEPPWVMLAHRASYALFCGPIPDEKCVCHKCDVPLCVNPDHLFIDTHAGNMADRDRKGRLAHGERMGPARLTENDVRAIRKSTETNAALAARYGRALATIQHARSGRYWKRVRAEV